MQEAENQGMWWKWVLGGVGISKRGTQGPHKVQGGSPKEQTGWWAAWSSSPTCQSRDKLKRMTFLVQEIQLLTSEMGGPSEKNKSLPH